MDPLTSPALRALGAALATATATGVLSNLAQKWGTGRWPSLTALVLGPDDPDKGDLRFAAVVASVGSGLAWVVALDNLLRQLSPSGRAAGIALGFPAIALGVTALADAIARRDELAGEFFKSREVTNDPVPAANASDAEDEDEELAAELEEDTGGSRPELEGARAGEKPAGESVRAGEKPLGDHSTVGVAKPAVAEVGKALTGIFPPGTQEALRAAVRAGSAVAGAASAVAQDPRVQAVASAAAGAAIRGGSTVIKGAVSAVADAVTPKGAKTATGERERVRRLIDEALSDVGSARARTDDPSIREALSSMEEALAGYAQIVDDEDADLDRIAVRCREVMALAASCEDDDGADAFRALGLRRDATLEQAKRVYRDLARIYHADAGAAGVDEDKFKEITVAYERVRSTLETRAAA